MKTLQQKAISRLNENFPTSLATVLKVLSNDFSIAKFISDYKNTLLEFKVLDEIDYAFNDEWDEVLGAMQRNKTWYNDSFEIQKNLTERRN